MADTSLNNIHKVIQPRSPCQGQGHPISLCTSICLVRYSVHSSQTTRELTWFLYLSQWTRPCTSRVLERQTRMHSSRMPTVRCSGHLWGVCPGVCLPWGCTPPPPPVDRILDTRLWKHYLPATTVADGKNSVVLYSVRQPHLEDGVFNVNFTRHVMIEFCTYHGSHLILSVLHWFQVKFHLPTKRKNEEK